MEFKKVTLWGLNSKNKWVRRKNFECHHHFIWNRREYAEPYENKYGMNHAFFPVGVNPNDHPVIFEMLKIVNRKVKAYQSDFYYHDCIHLFECDQDVIWSVRESGTDMFEINGEYQNEASKQWDLTRYKYNEGTSRSYYRIMGDKLKVISYDKGLTLIEKRKISA